MHDQQNLLLKANLKQLRLPTISAECGKLAREATEANERYETYLLRLTELEVASRATNALQARIVGGARFTYETGSTATVDEKALRVIEDAGLILLPFSTFDHEVGLFAGALQFIGLEETTLREYGTIEHRGFVRRADLLDQRVWLLSDEAFQTVNVDDLNHPASLAVLEIISEQELLDAGFWGCATAARENATRVTTFFGGGPCGFIGLVPFISMLAGLGLLKLCSRRR